jgi:hypothetical protein
MSKRNRKTMNQHTSTFMSLETLPEIVRIVLTEATHFWLRGQITTEVFEHQVERLNREELKPRGLTVTVQHLPWRGIVRFVIKTESKEQVRDTIEIGPDEVRFGSSCASNPSHE